MAKEVNNTPLADAPVTHRIDAIVVRAVVTSYNADGLPIGEALSQEMKVFRASVPDVWAALDRAVKVED